MNWAPLVFEQQSRNAAGLLEFHTCVLVSPSCRVSPSAGGHCVCVCVFVLVLVTHGVPK